MIDFCGYDTGIKYIGWIKVLCGYQRDKDIMWLLSEERYYVDFKWINIVCGYQGNKDITRLSSEKKGIMWLSDE